MSISNYNLHTKPSSVFKRMCTDLRLYDVFGPPFGTYPRDWTSRWPRWSRRSAWSRTLLSSTRFDNNITGTVQQLDASRRIVTARWAVGAATDRREEARAPDNGRRRWRGRWRWTTPRTVGKPMRAAFARRLGSAAVTRVPKSACSPSSAAKVLTNK